ncbi:MAG: hypothetical protein EZS28_048270, partial [Streblomastix strix]
MQTKNDLSPKPATGYVDQQTLITSLLCLIGALNKVKQMALQAHIEGRKCGGDFIIWCDTQISLDEKALVDQLSKLDINQLQEKYQQKIISYQEQELSVKQKYQQDKLNIKAQQQNQQKKIQKTLETRSNLDESSTEQVDDEEIENSSDDAIHYKHYLIQQQKQLEQLKHVRKQTEDSIEQKQQE